jgi:hypothetical protein
LEEVELFEQMVQIQHFQQLQLQVEEEVEELQQILEQVVLVVLVVEVVITQEVEVRQMLEEQEIHHQ